MATHLYMTQTNFDPLNQFELPKYFMNLWIIHALCSIFCILLIAKLIFNLNFNLVERWDSYILNSPVNHPENYGMAFDFVQDQEQDLSWFQISVKTYTMTSLDNEICLRPIQRFVLFLRGEVPSLNGNSYG